MKITERIAYFSFWVNLLLVIFLIIGLPVLFIAIPGFADLLFANRGRNPLINAIYVFYLVAVFHWGYCVWFLFKYDRYSKSIFPLLFLNFFYAPVYYYRVKIRKRPLRNKINRPADEAPDSEDHSIDEDDFVTLTRQNILGVLRLWASPGQQMAYQKSVPIAQVSSELFGQWDDFYTEGAEVMSEAFSLHELELLKKFDLELTSIGEKIRGETPPIESFIQTSEWQELNNLAGEIVKNLEENDLLSGKPIDAEG